jgi:hypothetical protein
VIRYVVSDVPVSSLSRPQLLAEAAELRVGMRNAEHDLAVKRAWAAADGKSRTGEYLKWRANALTFLGKLASRYAEIKERLRQHL